MKTYESKGYYVLGDPTLTALRDVAKSRNTRLLKLLRELRKG